MRRSGTFAASLVLMLSTGTSEAVDLAIDYGVLERAIQEVTDLSLTNLRVGADRIEVTVDFKGGVTQ